MIRRLIFWVSAMLLLVGGAAARAQSVDEIQAEIDGNPFMALRVQVRDLEVQDGYLYASVFGLGENGVEALRSNKPLSMIVDSDPGIVGLLRLEPVLLSKFGLKDVFWTPIPKVPATQAQLAERLAKLVIVPGNSIGEIGLGIPFEGAGMAYGAKVVLDTADMKTARVDLGDMALYIYAKNGPSITEIRVIDGSVSSYGYHGLHQLVSTIAQFPKTAEGIGLGSKREDVILAFGAPSRSGNRGLGGCGVRNRSDESIAYPGLSMRICDGIVVDISVE